MELNPSFLYGPRFKRRNLGPMTTLTMWNSPQKSTMIEFPTRVCTPSVAAHQFPIPSMIPKSLPMAILLNLEPPPPPPLGTLLTQTSTSTFPNHIPNRHAGGHLALRRRPIPRL